MQKVNYVASWRPEAKKFYKDADAQTIAEEIYSLGENPQTAEVLELARNRNTELHKVIEWDDNVAADKYRLEQCRRVMQDLRIIKVGLNNKKPTTLKVPLRMFYSLQGEEGYRPTPVILQSEDLHEKLLMTAKSELNAFVNKYSALTELEPVFKAIRELNSPAA